MVTGQVVGSVDTFVMNTFIVCCCVKGYGLSLFGPSWTVLREKTWEGAISRTYCASHGFLCPLPTCAGQDSDLRNFSVRRYLWNC